MERTTSWRSKVTLHRADCASPCYPYPNLQPLSLLTCVMIAGELFVRAVDKGLPALAGIKVAQVACNTVVLCGT